MRVTPSQPTGADDDTESSAEPLMVFDHGGQRRFHVMHTSLWQRQCSVFVIVVPTRFPFEPATGSHGDWIRQANEMLRRWLALIDTLAHPQSRIVVFCNKCSCQNAAEARRRETELGRRMQHEAREREKRDREISEHEADVRDRRLRDTRRLQHLGAPRLLGISQRPKQLDTGQPRLHSTLVHGMVDAAAVDNEDVAGIEQCLHDQCGEMRAELRMNRICVAAANVVREMATEGLVLATLADIETRLRSIAPDEFSRLQLNHIAGVVAHLEGCGAVLCLDQPASSGNVGAEERVVVNPDFFCSKMLGQLFSERMWEDADLDAKSDTDVTPLDIRSACDSRFVVSTRTLNSWARMPDDAAGRTVADVLFDGDELVLPRLLCDMHWCIQVNPDQADAEPAWLPLFLLDDLELSRADMAEVLCPDADIRGEFDSAVWVQLGRRVRCSDPGKTVLNEVFMHVQQRMVSRYVTGESAPTGDDAWDLRLWGDGVLLSRQGRASCRSERTSILLRHVFFGEANQHFRIKAVDVYACGTLHDVNDWRACASGGRANAHRLQALLQEVVDQAVVPALKAANVAVSRPDSLDMRDPARDLRDGRAPLSGRGAAEWGCIVPGSKEPEELLRRSVRSRGQEMWAAEIVSAPHSDEVSVDRTAQQEDFAALNTSTYVARIESIVREMLQDAFAHLGLSPPTDPTSTGDDSADNDVRRWLRCAIKEHPERVGSHFSDKDCYKLGKVEDNLSSLRTNEWCPVESEHVCSAIRTLVSRLQELLRSVDGRALERRVCVLEKTFEAHVTQRLESRTHELTNFDYIFRVFAIASDATTAFVRRVIRTHPEVGTPTDKAGTERYDTYYCLDHMLNAVPDEQLRLFVLEADCEDGAESKSSDAETISKDAVDIFRGCCKSLLDLRNNFFTRETW